jgi:hypothetical protein
MSKILTDEQSVELRAIMAAEGLSRSAARWRVLTPEQREQWAAQSEAARQGRRTGDPCRELLVAKRADAKRKGIEFTITGDDLDWPTHCPVLGVELRYAGDGHGDGRRGPHRHAATIDCVDNTKGYVPGNVLVVSHWVNLRKGDATVEQLRRIAGLYDSLDLM